MARKFAFALLSVALLAPFAAAIFDDKDIAVIKQNGVALSKNVNFGGVNVNQNSAALVKNDVDLPKLGGLLGGGKLDGADIKQNGLAISSNFNKLGLNVDQKSIAAVNNDVDFLGKKGNDKALGRKMLL